VRKAQPVSYDLVLGFEHLANKDVGGKSDPFFIIRAKPFKWYSEPYSPTPAAGEGSVVVVFKSEMIKDDLNPRFKPFRLDVPAVSTLSTQLFVEVFDWDADGTHDLIGQRMTTLQELIAPNAQMPIIDPKKEGHLGYKNSGTLKVMVATPVFEPLVPPAQAYEFVMQVKRVPRKDLGGVGKSDPFLNISGRPYGHKDHRTLHKTEHHSNTTEAKFAPFVLRLADCGGLDHHLNIELYDYDPASRDDCISYVKVSLRELLLSAGKKKAILRLHAIDGTPKKAGILKIKSATPR